MQLSQPVEPFGEVNVFRQRNGTLQVKATILMEPDIEGARTGLALDASASMKKMYGVHSVPPIFNKGGPPANVVEPVAQTMANYLARFSSNGKVQLIYWACSTDGSQVQPIGEYSDAESERISVRGPRNNAWGRGTKLLPPVRHFIDDAFRAAPWAICVFVTDGVIEDLEEVKRYSLQFARQIASGQRKFVKLVLLGVGEEVDEGQMEQLDDMFEGSGLVDPKVHAIDLWDHKLASEMKQLAEIFAEVVSEDTIVSEWGRIKVGVRAVKEYTDGLPALLEFTLPAGATSFTLEFSGASVTQDISEAL